MKTIDSLINFCDRVATPRMTATQIEIIEKKLLNLAEVDGEAARHYADLYRSRLDWEQTRSAEQRLNFVDQARNAQAWLAVIPSEIAPCESNRTAPSDKRGGRRVYRTRNSFSKVK